MSNIESIGSVFISIRSTLMCAVSHIVPPKEIEDIVQETYVRVCQVENPKSIRHPQSFMLKTARNLALDHIKRAETRLCDSMDDELEVELNEQYCRDDDTYDHVAANQELGHFCEAVRNLPPRCRKAYVMKRVYGYSQREIATVLNISERTVEKHIAAGIRRCSNFMELRAVVNKDPVGVPHIHKATQSGGW